eukprot:EG_transcript_2090
MQSALPLLRDGDPQQQEATAQEVLRLFETKDDAIQQLEAALADCEARLQRTEDAGRREQQVHRLQYTQLAQEKKMVVEELKDAVRRCTGLEAELFACRQQQQAADMFAPRAPPPSGPPEELLVLQKANADLHRQVMDNAAAKEQVQTLQDKLAALVLRTAQLDADHQGLRAQLHAKEEQLRRVQEEAALVGGLQDALGMAETRGRQLEATLALQQLRAMELQCAERRLAIEGEEWEGRARLIAAAWRRVAQVLAQEGQAWQGRALSAEQKAQRVVALAKRSTAENLAKDTVNTELRQQCEASAEELRRLRGCLAAAEADSVAARQQLAAARAEGDARRREQLQAAEECSRLRLAAEEHRAKEADVLREVQRLSGANVELFRNAQNLQQECQRLTESNRLQMEATLQAEANAREAALAREQAGQKREQLQAELVAAQSALAQAQAVVAGTQAEATAQQAHTAAAAERSRLLERQVLEGKAALAKLRLGQLRLQERLREGDAARVVEAVRQGEQTAELLQRLMEDRERLAQQLAAEQSDGRAEAERMRLELEKLAAHHAEALQLAAEQQWRAEQRLREEGGRFVALQIEADKLAEDNKQLRDHIVSLETRCQQLSAELKNSRACYARLAGDLTAARREAQQEQDQWRARLEALQAAVHREEEWGGVQRQLAECREQCRAAKEDAARRAKAAETLKLERDALQAGAKKSAEALSAAEARERQTRKDLTRVTQSLADLRARTTAAEGRSREQLETIARLEAQLEAVEKEKETRDVLLRTSKAAAQQRFARLHSQLAQVVTWLVKQTEDAYQQVQRRRQQCKALRATQALPAVHESVYQSAGQLSQSLFALNLGDILHGAGDGGPGPPPPPDLEGDLRRLAAAVEGKPGSGAAAGPDGADLAALLFQLVEGRLRLEHTLARLAVAPDG